MCAPSLSVLLQACREEGGFVEESWDSICGSWTSASHLSDNHHFSYLILGHFLILVHTYPFILNLLTIPTVENGSDCHNGK